MSHRSDDVKEVRCDFCGLPLTNVRATVTPEGIELDLSTVRLPFDVKQPTAADFATVGRAFVGIACGACQRRAGAS